MKKVILTIAIAVGMFSLPVMGYSEAAKKRLEGSGIERLESQSCRYWASVIDTANEYRIDGYSRAEVIRDAMMTLAGRNGYVAPSLRYMTLTVIGGLYDHPDKIPDDLEQYMYDACMPN